MEEYASLKQRVCCKPAERVGPNVLRFGETLEEQDRFDELAIVHRRMEVLAIFMNEHQPVTQTQTQVVRVGNLIRAVYDDAAGKEQKLAFVLGGENEPEIYRDHENPDADVRTISYLASFGKAFIGKEVGDTVEVQVNGVLVEAEIDTIELAPEPKNVQQKLRLIA